MGKSAQGEPPGHVELSDVAVRCVEAEGIELQIGRRRPKRGDGGTTP